MKRILRVFVIEAYALYIVSQITTGLVFENGGTGIILTGIVIGLASFLIKPVINILILPLNLLTFGVFKFIGNAITLFLVDLVLDQFKVGSFYFAGLGSALIDLPSFGVPEGAASYIIFSLFISLITTAVYWLVT